MMFLISYLFVFLFNFSAVSQSAPQAAELQTILLEALINSSARLSVRFVNGRVNVS